MEWGRFFTAGALRRRVKQIIFLGDLGLLCVSETLFRGFVLAIPEAQSKQRARRSPLVFLCASAPQRLYLALH